MSTGVERAGPAFLVSSSAVNADRSLDMVALELELGWFERVLAARLQLHFAQPCEYRSIDEIEAPDLTNVDAGYARLVNSLAMDFDQRLLVILALIPHLRPQLLDTLCISNQNLGRGFSEFGGAQPKHHAGFLPTGETAAFLLAGTDLSKRFEVLELFHPDHPLMRAEILSLSPEIPGEPALSRALAVSDSCLARLAPGVTARPGFSADFPARKLSARLSWEDLVLAPEVREEIENIKTWLIHESTIMDEWGLGKSLMPGYRSLFYGPPGTGKTLTASLIGAATGREVYRIDLSMVVSKYIGETEKNLAGVFDRARNQRWILFFDEADALFGKRTQTTSAHDRYANQEVSYLLQRVEEFAGVVILASNLRANIDEAFSRRFQSIVYFPMPDANERERLWRVVLAGRSRLADDVDLQMLAERFELSGGAMTNVVRAAALSALRGGQDRLRHCDLMAAITRELRKEGKSI